MGLFDALSDLTSAVVKTALTPVAVAVDAAKVVTGNEPDTTKDLLKSAAQDLEDAGNEIT